MTDIPVIQSLGPFFGNDRIICRVKKPLVLTVKLSDHSLDAVTHHRVAHLATCGDPHSRHRASGDENENDEVGAVDLPPVPGNQQKLGAFPEAFCFGKPRHQVRLLCGYGDSEPLSPLGTTTLDYQPAIFGGHANKEPVGSFSRRITRLERSFHDSALLTYTDRELNY